jgi:ATP-dependent DNA helicase RecG
MKLFNGYDCMAPGCKKSCVVEVIRHVTKLKAIVNNLPMKPREIGRPPIPRCEASTHNTLASHVQTVRGVGPRTAGLLAKKGLFTIDDLLYFTPRRYEDRRTICNTSELIPGIRQTVLGKITQSNFHFYGKRRIFEVLVDDGHGVLKAKRFKGGESFLRSAFAVGRRVVMTGEVSRFPFEKEMIHPDYEILDDREDQLSNVKRIMPIYSATEGLRQRALRRIMWQVVQGYAHLLRIPIPEEVAKKHRLIDMHEAVRRIHFPDADQEIQAYQETGSDAHRTLIYDEFFYFQLGLALRKAGRTAEQGISLRRTER